MDCEADPHADKERIRTSFDGRPAHLRPFVLHLACHGVMDERDPMLSNLRLSADDRNDGALLVREIFDEGSASCSTRKAAQSLLKGGLACS
ncbi:MAG: CHAT domain-containing protein [Planctomycetota bacterium]